METPTVSVRVDPRVAQYKNVTDLRQFKKKYKVVDDGTDDSEGVERIWGLCINGRSGQIYPIGFNGDLGVMSNGRYTIPKLVKLGLEVVQGIPGESLEVALRFPVARIHEVAVIIGARRSRLGRCSLSPEQRAAATARLIAFNAARKAAKIAKATPVS